MDGGGIVWFRKDLRLHDNEALYEAIRSSSFIIPIYVFDIRELTTKTSFGFDKTGAIRTNFIIESVINLKEQFLNYGIQLIVKVGIPEEEIFAIARTAKTSWVFCNRERTQEEVDIQDTLEQNLWSIGQEIRFTKGKMLYYTGDLPFPVTHTPDSFSQFKKELERFVPVRKVLTVDLENVNTNNIHIESDPIPEFRNLSEIANLKRENGGEEEALERLDELVQEISEVGNEKNAAPLFSKLSPHLALGCLSPKMYWSKIKPLSQKYKKNKTLQDWREYLIYRDYCRLIAKKYGNKIFHSTGIQEQLPDYQNKDAKFIHALVHIRTGIPIIDAILTELIHSGYISHQKRRLLASFIHHDLKLDWRIGAEFFESYLIDYDVSSNYINWQWVAGIGPNSKETKFVNAIKEGQRIDSTGAFIKSVLPIFAELATTQIHTPWLYKKELVEQHNLQLGRDYPNPITLLDF